MTRETLSRALRAFLAVIEAEESERDGDWIDQSTSPLGPRRHCALARRLIAAGDKRAARAGRRWLLRAEALSLPVPTSKRPKRAESESESAAARAARRLSRVA
jgi:hypothetical protein